MAEPLKVLTQQESWLQEVDASIVQMLEDVLARAKQGEFTGMALSFTCKDGSTFGTYSKMDHQGLIIAGLERLKFGMLSNS